MTQTSEITVPKVSNQFSWKRAWAISSLYEPAIKWQMAIYALMSLLTGAITYTLNASAFGILSMGLLGTVTGFMLYFGPIVFARKSNMVIETTLPATNAEKCAFYILYSVVVLPLLINVPYYAVLLIGNAIHPIADTLKDIIDLQNEAITKTCGISLLSSLLPITVCLYTLMANEKNRIVKAILWTIGVNILMGLIGAIYGVVMAVSGTPFVEADATASTYELGQQIGKQLKNIIFISGLTSGVVSAIMIWLTCRKISNRQL